MRHVSGVLVFLLLLTGCQTTEQSVLTGTALLARTPANQLEQIYYLGSFDPQGQLPPTIYRIRVRGQSSAFSRMKFSSGWVPASLVDSLSTPVGFDSEKFAELGTASQPAELDLQRRLVQFGPEGFREAPKDHRLVIVMGSDPSAFFTAVGETLGDFTQIEQLENSEDLRKTLTETLIQLQAGEIERIKLQIEMDDQTRALAALKGEE